jgi:predicted metal-binding membrane protein
LSVVPTRLASPLTRYPQWWVIGGAAAAWAALAAQLAGAHSAHAGHAAPGGTGFAVWSLMCVAMMVPVTLPALRHVYANSIRSRRQWATVVYLTAYLAVWIAFGIVAMAVRVPVESRLVAIGLLCVAAVWQLTHTKRRALLACRRTIPLPPQGRRADAACARFGLRQAWRCVVTCWPLMLLMALVPVHVAVMAVLAGFMYAEERTHLGRQMVRPAAALLVVAAIGLATFG